MPFLWSNGAIEALEHSFSFIFLIIVTRCKRRTEFHLTFLYISASSSTPSRSREPPIACSGSSLTALHGEQPSGAFPCACQLILSSAVIRLSPISKFVFFKSLPQILSAGSSIPTRACLPRSPFSKLAGPNFSPGRYASISAHPHLCKCRRPQLLDPFVLASVLRP
jgi:hypothetical protein